MLDCIALARPMPVASAENLALHRPNMAVLEIIFCCGVTDKICHAWLMICNRLLGFGWLENPVLEEQAVQLLLFLFLLAEL